MKEIIFLNGKFINPQEAKISVFSPGFLLGYGLFETMRSYHNRIVYFDGHLKRLGSSCDLIGIKLPYPGDKLKAIIHKAVKLIGSSDNRIRLALWKSEKATTDILITVKKYEPYPDKKYRIGFRACVCPLRQNEFSLLTRIKTANRLLYELANLQAKNKGLDEAIILNSRGFICEASRSNIFLAKGNELLTPSLGCGCLEGITRKVIFDLAEKYNIRISEGNFTIDDLYKMDEAFLTNSLMGVMPLVFVENRGVGKGKSGKLTEFFIRQYNFLFK